MSAVKLIRFDVKPETHRSLKARAALDGKTLKAFVRDLAEASVADARPATDREEPTHADSPAAQSRPVNG